MKYKEYKCTFSEIPDEICLCVNITNCPFNCEGCHSPWLREDIGEELTFEEIKRLIFIHDGITCLALMGGDSNVDDVVDILRYVKNNFRVKTAWYSGSDSVNKNILEVVDYLKLGKYDKEKGGLASSTTNQRVFTVNNITYKYFKY